MAVVETVRCGEYKFGLSFRARQEVVRRLIDLIEHPTLRETRILEGRGEISIGEVPEVGSVVVKHYARGGILRHMVSRYYLRIGQVRPEAEFNCLERVRSIGVSAPEPLAYAYVGGIFYRGWLFTREIKNHISLAALNLSDDGRADACVRQAARQLNILIDHGILHVDLHPGNVLIDSGGAVHIIDFDRARLVRWSREQLRDYYLCRWRRAVIKHHLPDALSEMLSLHLRMNTPMHMSMPAAREL